MCIALGYGLYKKSQAKKRVAGTNSNNDPNEKSYAPKPHHSVGNAGPKQPGWGDRSDGQPPKADGPEQRV